jgi:hypothetical protein
MLFLVDSMDLFYETVPCSDFQAFTRLVEMLPHNPDSSWVFRGQEKSCWKLRTSLEREADRFHLSADELFRREYNMVREFRRRLHHYQTSVPHRDNVDEWLALMQHYGAPTRLIDFTYSPYVAAYFAFESARSGDIAIWAIDIGSIQKAFIDHFPELNEFNEKYGNYRDPEAFRELFLKDGDESYVLSVNPFRLNDRLAYQQGVFLCPASLRVSFMGNLEAVAKCRNKKELIKKICIPVTGDKLNNRDDALKRLHQMNINRTTLFPGLGGFAESFKVGINTVYGAHYVIKQGNLMPNSELWKSLSDNDPYLE